MINPFLVPVFCSRIGVFAYWAVRSFPDAWGFVLLGLGVTEYFLS